ncbi:6-phospho-alpha-glucosidase [Terribacillus saccharophilus]|uniref:family 4 glycosyl hydrolase n=1 Tax=Terribacillus saccharophilus TaxID=361277 RepID=UPI000BA652EA|nr:6-phospho-alpha-glucosidase [Terribacillus saccharophilus]PAF39745.1 6-phospho-alpha-glucosidase [Terribacillus saccharophilus]
MKRKLKIAIFGGGSTYTLGLIKSLIVEKESFPLKELVLFDQDEERQKIIADAAAILLKEQYGEDLIFTSTTNLESACKDADSVFIQIRTGGLEMRELDERIPLSHGVVGQETCGPGGMAYGIRSIKDMIDLIKNIRAISKDAWILNYTNPAAIVAYALKKQFPDDNRILNICDMPIAIMVSYAKLLGVDIWDLTADYFGLNHFGWFTKIEHKDGTDYTERLKERIIEEGFRPEDEEIANDVSWQETFAQARQTLLDFPEYLPNTYLQYYLYPDKIVEKSDPTSTRARQVIEGRQKRVHDMCKRIAAGSASSEDLKADIHGIFIIRAAASLAYNLKERYIVMVENNGIIPNLPSDAIVEVPALLTANGIHAFAIGEIPVFHKGLIEGQYAYERLVCEAYFEKDYKKLLQAMTLNRTVVDADKAKRILDDLQNANQKYWPSFQ